MEQITLKLDTMEDVKREIDLCQRKAMTSVVELGYILRKADDAELYKQEGYTSIYKFAKETYGWDQSQTSRFMDINREFSEGGYSTTLQARYEGFGKAKLAEMLTLPEAIREEIPQSAKREEIRELKRDLKEAAGENAKEQFEKTVTLQAQEEDPLSATVEKLFALPDMGRKIKKLYPYMQMAAKNEPVPEEDVRMQIALSGFGTVRAGGAMYFWKKDNFSILQGMDKRTYSYTDLLKAINDISIPEEDTPEEWYRNTYGKEMPGQEKPKAGQKKEVEQKKQNPVKQEKKVKQSVEKSTPERTELPGQEEIKNHAEKMPITYEKDEETIEPVAPAHKPEKEDNAGGCPYCQEGQNIVSDKGTFTIHLAPNGLGKITGGQKHGNIVFLYCPMCGKKLKGE